MTTVLAHLITAITIIGCLIILNQQLIEKPNWLDRSRFMCFTSESQEEKEFWCN